MATFGNGLLVGAASRSVLASLATSALVAFTASLGVSCSGDPVQSTLIKSLGSEASGVPPGQYHRAGQPCTACHQAHGPGKGDFSIAGTIFYGPDRAEGVDNVQVRLIDANNQSVIVRTNCVGNFFIGRTETFDFDGSRVAPWNPVFPVLVSISKGELSKDMASLINREGSCAGCHRIPAGLDSPGHVFVGKAGNPPPVGDCPISPVVPIQTN